MRLDLPNQRTRGRHRRQQTIKHQQPLLSVIAVTAAVTLGLSVLGATDRPAAGPPAAVDVVPTEDPNAPSNEEILQRFLDPALLAAVPVGPERVAEPVRVVLSSSRVITTLGESGIPAVALRAYKQAAARLGSRDASCQLPWTLLAAIGRVESNHGRFGGAQLRADGSGTRPIRGIPLDGRPHVALIRDTENGALDGDTTYDRAVGPMQFIPSTWRSVMVDGNADGRRDPNNMFDATEGAGVYLCAGTGSLRDPDNAAGAVRRYNNADRYVRVVLSLARQYEAGRVVVVPTDPNLPTSQPTPTNRPAPTSQPAPTGRSTATPRPSTTPAPAPTASTTAPTAFPTGTPTWFPTMAPPPEQTETAEPNPQETSAEPTAPEPTPTAEPAGSEEPSSPAPTAEPPDTATVGWAPAMREVVLDLLDDATATPSAEPTECPDSPTQPPSAGAPAAVPPTRSPGCAPAAVPAG